MLVTRSSCLPWLFSTCANDLPSGEIAAQTDWPEFVSGVIFIVCHDVSDCGLDGLSKLFNRLDKCGRLGRINKSATTAASPPKVVALGCSFISLRIDSAVRRAKDFVFSVVARLPLPSTATGAGESSADCLDDIG